MLQYLDKQGRLLFVASGLGGNNYGTFCRKSGGSGIHRVKSQSLPMRNTREAAEADFAAYVIKHRLVPVTVSHEE